MVKHLSRLSPSVTPFYVSINGNMDLVPSKLIEQIKSEIDGQVIDRSRVIDHLLDLRLEAATNPTFTASIDKVLGDVPGHSMVETDWWTSTLDRFSTLADHQPA